MTSSRRAVLAALLASLPVRAQKKAVWMRIVLPEAPFGSPRKETVDCQGPAYGPGMKCVETIYPTPYETHLEVRYKDRVVRLTGDQIMDALEGK